jgi:endonuclease/exonuclease/phosphatase family metal-dependent hydrolase
MRVPFFRISRIASLVLASLATVLPQREGMAAEPLQLKVMTFNIRRDGEETGPNHWQERREMVVELIHHFAGDFVGIQEAKPNQVADLNAMLPEYRSIALSREADPTRGEAAPIYYRCERWTLDPAQTGTFWLSNTPDKPGSKSWSTGYPRIVTWGRFVEQPSGRAVYVFNTHFGEESARQKSAALLAEHVAHVSMSNPVIVTGDLNAGETSGVVKFLTEATPTSPVKLLDTFRAANPDAKEVGTTNEFRGGTNGSKIDYIFVLPNTKVLSATIIHDHIGARYPSDHYPVTAEVVVP